MTECYQTRGDERERKEEGRKEVFGVDRWYGHMFIYLFFFFGQQILEGLFVKQTQ